MMKAFGLAAGAAAMIALAVPASATQIVTTVSASSASYTGDINSLNDGIIPPLRTCYCDMSVYDFGDTIFTFDFGGAKTITDVLASVDNNDDYTINFFNGSTYVITFFIPAALGPVTESEGGFDTFASFGGPDITQLGGSALFTATSATIGGSGGDGLFGVGEVQFFNNSRAVPEPATWAMMIGGLGLVGAALRRRATQISFA